MTLPVAMSAVTAVSSVLLIRCMYALLRDTSPLTRALIVTCVPVLCATAPFLVFASDSRQLAETTGSLVPVAAGLRGLIGVIARLERGRR